MNHLPAATRPSSPCPGGGNAPCPSFRLPQRKDSATARTVYLLIDGVLLLAIGSVIGASLHTLLAMVG
jgi:hypothetical protein